MNICATLTKNFMSFFLKIVEELLVAKKPVKKVAKKTVKRAAPKKRAAAPVAKKLSAVTEKQTKAQIIADIAEDAGVDKKAVKAVFVSLQRQVQRHLIGRGSGEMTIPELAIKVRRVRKPATKARKGRNPFTGEEIMIKAKPARSSVRATALKKLKELVG